MIDLKIAETNQAYAVSGVRASAPAPRPRGHREDLADDEPFAEHADRGQVLLDGRDRSGVSRDVGGYVERGHGGEAEAPRLAPREKLPRRPPVRRPRPLVDDPSREELQEPRHRIQFPLTITCGSVSPAAPLSVPADVAAPGTSASLIPTPLPLSPASPLTPASPPSTSASNRS